MLLLNMFFEFLKIGAFSIGGGLATIPFLIKLSQKTGWYSIWELSNMIAISESTPGPIGINMATYVGFYVKGIIGAITSVFSIVLPSFVIIIFAFKYITKFKNSIWIKNALNIIKPVVVALILTSFISIFKVSIYNGNKYLNIIVFFVIFTIVYKIKIHPIMCIFLGGILGFLLKL